MKMKSATLILVMICAAAAMPGMIPSAGALTIDPTTAPQWTTDVNSNLNAAQIASLVGFSGDLFLLYKQDVGAATDTGPGASAYTTIFSNTASDPSNATITHVPDMGWIQGGGGPLYLYVKDGKNSPAAYVFDLSALGWDGMEKLELVNFWTGQGAISNIAIYGGPTASVPEPSTMLLLGIGLLGAAGIGRRFRK